MSSSDDRENQDFSAFYHLAKAKNNDTKKAIHTYTTIVYTSCRGQEVDCTVQYDIMVPMM